LLYTGLPSEELSADGFRGLGHVDSHKDKLSIDFELKAIVAPTDPSVIRKASKGRQRDKTVEVILAQDKTALRSRKGDTGSVLWKASVDLAQVVLQQHYSHAEDSLLKRDLLPNAHVFELGAGTGLLGIVLSPLVRQYTVTDIPDLLPLIRKNLSLNYDGWSNSKGPGSNITVEALDWLQLHRTPLAVRPRLIPVPTDPIDLILAVDCIYNPSLLPALVETIDFLTTPEKTAVLIVMELRQEDVVREFLGLWLAKGGWEIRRVASAFIGVRYAVWVGWKSI